MRYTLLCLCLAPLFAQADVLDLSLNDDTFAARYVSPKMRSTAQFDLGWLHHADNGDMANLGLLVEQSKQNGLSIGLGATLLGITSDNADLAALALGGRLNWTIPSTAFKLGGHVYYAPRVVTFGDGKRVSDVGVRFGYQALDNAEVYVAFQTVKARLDNDARLELTDDLRIGFALSF